MNPAHIIYFTFLPQNQKDTIRIFSNYACRDQTWAYLNLHLTDHQGAATEKTDPLGEPCRVTVHGRERVEGEADAVQSCAVGINREDLVIFQMRSKTY